MAKYSRFDPRNKKKNKNQNQDRYRSDKRKTKFDDNQKVDVIEYYPNRKNRSV